MFGFSALYTAIVAIIIASFGGMGGYIWYQSTQIELKDATITVINSNLVAEQIAHDATTKSFEENLMAIAMVNEEMEQLNVNIKELREDNTELSSKLARHDLEALSLAKPTLIEGIINQATKDIMERIKTITGGNE